jgi:UDP-N-acetylglucosamine 2-epimerase (non-hydrolysing)
MSTTKLKLMTVVGTRPEIIRLSRVMSLADRFFNHIIVHTGQNYDYELNEIFFKELGIRKPDHFLNVDTSSLGASIGDIMRKSEEIMHSEKPDALLVLGDTNSCLSAYMAKRLHIPIYHMEAGNRCYDFNVPEEINRRVIDHISDFNLVYTEHARRHLISEGLPHRRIYLTGSPMYEVLMHYKSQIDAADSLVKLQLKPKQYFVVSIHREENVDNPENLTTILDILNTIAENYNYPVIVSTHPRTRKRIENLKGLGTNKLIQFMKPFGFNDYVNLQMNAVCTISDSGTISEESSILNFPAITLRNSMERPEAIDTGVIILTGFNKQTVINSVDLVIEEKKSGINPKIPAEYCIDNTSWRVIKLITGTAKLSNKWHGVTS